MGKTNKANRTKGNTRPSSSGHSAQLLSVDGRALSGFVGFDALNKETASYVPVTGQHAEDATDNTVDSDFRMVMRKMLKRDAVTRLKAMQEFGEHCVEKEVDIVKNVLPFWPRLFNKLALDSDRRIREATHQANRKLLTKVKREMAPYLKNIMGVWLLGQCDLYAPAASAAQAIFSSTFPTNKQSEAVMFCKNEIFSYFKDNLFEQTAKTMSDPNVATPEDMENKYILVISATLQALKLFLKLLPKKELDAIHEYFFPIVAENKFWKFAKHKEAQIRGAWCALISSMCQIKPDIFKETEKKLATTVFGCLSESDPIVAPLVWESILSIVVNFSNCWEDINIHKVVLPQLWSLLKAGGKGNARILYPCLLPFLSKLPKEVMESENFLSEFFSCLKQSLLLESVKSSTIECDAILATFFESLQFVCWSRLGKEKAGQEFLHKILMNEVIPLLESSFFEESNSHLSVSKLYMYVGSLIKKTECINSNQNEKISEGFKNILIAFWEQIFLITCKILSKEESVSMPLVYLSFFYTNILQPVDCSVKQQKRTVRFEEDNRDKSSEKEKSSEKPSSNESTVEVIDKKSQTFHYILKVCEILCQKIDENFNEGCLRLFSELLGCAASQDLVIELMAILSKTRNFDPGSAYDFFEKVIAKWLKKVSNDQEHLTCIFNIIFIVCSYIPEDEVRKIFNRCCELGILYTECLIKTGLSLRTQSSVFQNWLNNSSSWYSNAVNDLQLLINEDKFYDEDGSAIPEIQIYQRLLKMCLEDAQLCLAYPDICFKKIVELLSVLTKEIFVQHMTTKRIDHILYFVYDIIRVILKKSQICWKYEETEKFFYEVFYSNLYSVVYLKSSDAISPVLYEILDALVDSYVEGKDEVMSEDSLLYKIVTELSVSLGSLQSQEQAVIVQKHCLFFISSVQKYLAIHKPDLNSTHFVFYKLMDTFLPSEDVWDRLKEDLTVNILPLFLKKKIFYPLLSSEKLSYPEDCVLTFNLVTNAVSQILSSEVLVSSNEEEATKFLVHYVNAHFPQFLWCLTFNNGIKSTEKTTSKSLTEQIEQTCMKILSLLTESDIDQLIEKLFDMSLFDEDWALCMQTLYEMHPTCNLGKLANQKFDSISSEWPGLSKYVVRQVLIHHLSTEKKQSMLKDLMQDLMKMEDPTDKNLAGRMGELCCYLLDKDNMLSTADLQSFLKGLFNTIINFDFRSGSYENLKYTYHLQMIHILSCSMEYELYLVDPKIWNFLVNLLCIEVEECMFKTFDSPTNLMCLYQAVTIFSSLCELQAQLLDTESDWKPKPISDHIYEDVIHLFIYIANALNDSGPLPEMCEIVMSKYLEAVTYIPGKNLISMMQCENPEVKLNNEFSVFKELIMLLTSCVRQIQFASHTLLLKIMPIIPSTLSEKSQCSSEDEFEEDALKIPDLLSPLVDQLKTLTEIAHNMLLDLKIGDLCTIVPYTDSYTFSMGYLLAWIELMEFISASPSQIRLGYAIYLKEMELLTPLFSNVFHFMPENPVTCLKKGLKLETPSKEDLKLLFIKPPKLNSVSPSSEEIQSIACYVFSSVLRTVPASIRQWWANLDKRSADVVNCFTSKYVSGLLCATEIQAVHENEKQFENLMVQARPGSREVIATYTIDDCAIELYVQLPVNHPLGPIKAERRGKVVIGQMEWRHWLMQLTTVLTYQNGSILDGLTIWKRNLDKKFEGVEECMICYYILHNSTLKLPKLSCHVCRKKFHSACLYKWFRTSNNFTCPLCRNEFTM